MKYSQMSTAIKMVESVWVSERGRWQLWLILSYLIIPLVLLISCKESTEQFSIVLIPDTQFYPKKNPAIYENQTKWIVENRESRNIKFSIHLGDIVFDVDSVDQWIAASKAHEILDHAAIPYSIMPGNHDMDIIPDINEMDSSKAFSLKPATNFNRFFGVNRFQDKAPAYGGHYGDDNNNTYWFFTASGFKFMVLSLEYNARPKALAWASQLIKKYSNHLVIVASHCYLTPNEEYGDCPLDLGYPGLSHKVKLSGRRIFDNLVARHKNVFMVVSGHKSGSVYRETMRGELPPVIELQTDYSRERPLGREETGNLGNGWLRILTFDLEKNLIQVEPVSVEEGNTEIFEDGQPVFYNVSYPNDPSHPYHQFSMPFNVSDYLQKE